MPILVGCTIMGEGWHNNHHHVMGSARQGFFWWEIDVSYYILKGMSWIGLVWDLKEPPGHVYEPVLAQPKPVPPLELGLEGT